MNINFINKLPKKNNIINISSNGKNNSIKITSDLDIIKLSKSIGIIIAYNATMKNEIIFNLAK